MVVIYRRLAGAALLILLTTCVLRAQTYTAIHNFTDGLDGGMPWAGLVMDRSGNLYGTTTQGGTGFGTVFKLSPSGSSWIYSVLYTFQGGNDGYTPYATLTIGPDGALYGTTYFGGGNGCFGSGCGTVFRVSPAPSRCHAVVCPWIETVLYRFTGGADGAQPYFGALVFDAAGNLYGTASAGGQLTGNCSTDYGCGVVFKLTHVSGTWTESVLHTFTAGDDGIFPASGVVFDNAGNLYGTTVVGGTGVVGTVYELAHSGSSWTESILYNFVGPAMQPYGGVSFDSHGNLFGTTYYGSTGGTVYELSPSNGGWTFSTLVNLASLQQGPLTGVTIDSAGNLYGAAPGDEAIYKVTQENGGWTYSALHSFTGPDGATPIGLPIVDAMGNVYGTTEEGGTSCQYNGCGVVYKIAQ